MDGGDAADTKTIWARVIYNAIYKVYLPATLLPPHKQSIYFSPSNQLRKYNTTLTIYKDLILNRDHALQHPRNLPGRRLRCLRAHHRHRRP